MIAEDGEVPVFPFNFGMESDGWGFSARFCRDRILREDSDVGVEVSVLNGFVRIDFVERLKRTQPAIRDFDEDKEVGVLLGEPVEHLVIVFARGENVEGNDFEFWAVGSGFWRKAFPGGCDSPEMREEANAGDSERCFSFERDSHRDDDCAEKDVLSAEVAEELESPMERSGESAQRYRH